MLHQHGTQAPYRTWTSHSTAQHGLGLRGTATMGTATTAVLYSGHIAMASPPILRLLGPGIAMSA